MEEKLPSIDASLETYLKALELFKVDQKFSTYELATKIAGPESKEVIDEVSTLCYSHLYQLAMYGITSFFGASTFAITLSPEDPEEKWIKKLGERGAPLYEMVKGAYKKRVKVLKEKNYLPTFIGKSPSVDIIGYVYNTYDPNVQAGIRIESRGHFNIKARRVAEEIVKELSFYELEIKNISKSTEINPNTGESVVRQEIIIGPKE